MLSKSVTFFKIFDFHKVVQQHSAGEAEIVVVCTYRIFLWIS